MSTPILARYADASFWLARYMERVEDLARMLEIIATFSLEDPAHRNWYSAVQINGDDKRFAAAYPKATSAAVKQFYLQDVGNFSSIPSALFFGRENARTLRPVIATEMWAQINVFYNRVHALKAADLAGAGFSAVCGSIKESCQTHAGITEGTYYRDLGWQFYQIGKHLERADQTTRLLDIKYHLIAPEGAEDDPSIGGDLWQWQALLRSAAGYHAYRRLQTGRTTPLTVVGFLLMNDSFPRSVSLCLRRVEQLIGLVRNEVGTRGGAAALEVLDELLVLLRGRPVEAVVAEGLHEFLDWVQTKIGIIAELIAEDFFRARAAA